MGDQAFIEQLRPCPFRPKGPLPRVSSHLFSMVEEHGVVEPVVVRRVGGGYEILGNVEYWMAAQQARLDRVPIHILEGVSDADAEDIASATYAKDRANPIEEAEYFKSQVSRNSQGRSEHRAVTKLAYLTGYSRPYISHALRLLKLPVQIQQLVETGRLTGGHARALVTVDLRSAQLALAKRVVAESLTVRQTEALARDLREGRAPAVSTARQPLNLDPDTLRLQTKISQHLGCSVSIDPDAARIAIDYHNLEVLDGILAKIGLPFD